MSMSSEATPRGGAIPAPCPVAIREAARPMTGTGPGEDSVDGPAAPWLLRQKIAIPDRVA